MEAHQPDFQPAVYLPLKYPINELVPNVPFEEYVKAPGMNASSLKEFARSPAHYYEARYNRIEKNDTDALLKGRLIHLAVLEPERFKDLAVVEPIFEGLTAKGEITTSMNCKEVREKKATWRNELKSDAIIVPSDFLKDLTGMVNKILKHSKAAPLLREGSREVSLWWNDDETGELCKARYDFVSFYKNKNWLIDLKSTTDARESFFKRDILKYQYHLSAAHYCNGARISKTAKSEAFIFLVIEKPPPYEIAIYPAGATVLGIGSQWCSVLMKQYAECRKTGIYPGYNHKAQTIEMPTWTPVPDDNIDSYEY